MKIIFVCIEKSWNTGEVLFFCSQNINLRLIQTKKLNAHFLNEPKEEVQKLV